MGKFDKGHKDEPRLKSKPKHMPSDFSAEQQLTQKIADRILRDMPEMDVTVAANQEIQKEQRRKSSFSSTRERPTKRRKQ